MQYHLRVKDLPRDAKEATKKKEESPVERQDEPARMPKGIPATQQLPSAVQADVTCPACKGRHRAHTKQAGCRLCEETKVDDENLKETPKDATMTASSPAATDEELGRSAKKAKIAAEIEKVPEVSTQMDLETQTEMREDEPDTKNLKVQAVTEGLWNDITPEMLESGRNKELRQLDEFELYEH